MHQTKKGNQWFFGMKAHIAVDTLTKVIHAVAAAADVHDAACLPDLLHGEETKAWGDSAYQGQGPVIEARAPDAQDMTNRRYRRKGVVDEVERAKNKTKSGVWAKAAHPFLVIERIFGFAKTRYRGLEKNAHRLFVTCALTNLYLVRR
jgi:IS5 family transposase